MWHDDGSERFDELGNRRTVSQRSRQLKLNPLSRKSTIADIVLLFARKRVMAFESVQPCCLKFARELFSQRYVAAADVDGFVFTFAAMNGEDIARTRYQV